MALGRKNFLFVGSDESGENIAGLYSLVATCEANDINPSAYLADVLIRVHEHPNSRIDELLPENRPPEDPPACRGLISERDNAGVDPLRSRRRPPDGYVRGQPARHRRNRPESNIVSLGTIWLKDWGTRIRK